MCVLGDFNAKVGDNTEYTHSIIGRHGVSNLNENVSLLINLAIEHVLLINGTLFPHKNIHKYTWTSPDHRIEN